VAGERLINAVGHRIEEIEAELDALSELREKPAGTIQITAHEHALDAVLLPALSKFLPQYPTLTLKLQSTTVLPTSLPNASTRECDRAGKWRRTWLPSASGRTCAWLWSVHRPI